jgi:predicted transcriptional regulator
MIKPQPQTQQAFLRHAIKELGLTVDEFCNRISVPPKTFEKWLATDSAKNHRNMPAIAWSYIDEILKWHALEKKRNKK